MVWKIRILVAIGSILVLTGPAAAAEFDEITVRTSKPVTPLNEVLTARPGDAVYVERSYGQPGAHLREPLRLKKTPAGKVVTVEESTDLTKARVDGVVHYCAGHTLRVRRTKVRRPGFYICLRDVDADGATFEEVRIVTMVATILEEKRGRREVATSFKRSYEIDPPARLSPKPYVLTRINPDGDAYYEVIVTLKSVSPQKAVFVSELRDHKGKRIGDVDEIDADLAELTDRTVTVLHPMRGDLVYRLRRAPVAKNKERVHARRAARLQILSAEQDRLTYRVTRTFAPWRYALRGKYSKGGGMIYWAVRPKVEAGPESAPKPPAGDAGGRPPG